MPTPIMHKETASAAEMCSIKNPNAVFSTKLHWGQRASGGTRTPDVCIKVYKTLAVAAEATEALS